MPKKNIIILLTVTVILISTTIFLYIQNRSNSNQTIQQTVAENINNNISTNIADEKDDLSKTLSDENIGLKVSQNTVSNLEPYKKFSFKNGDELYFIEPDSKKEGPIFNIIDTIDIVKDKYYKQNDIIPNEFRNEESFYIILNNKGFLYYVPQEIIYISEFTFENEPYMLYQKKSLPIDGSSELFVSKLNFQNPKKVDIIKDRYIIEIVKEQNDRYIVNSTNDNGRFPKINFTKVIASNFI